MKRISISLLLTFILLIILSACKNDESIDWKITNDQWLTKFVQTHKNDSNFYTTSTGLTYQILYKGWDKNRKPNSGSTVVVNYKGSLIDGSVFDSVGKDSAVSLTLSNTIAGWQEALPKVYNGAHIKLYIPSNLGYGTSTSNTAIPANSVLIFDINLVDSY